MCRLIAHIKASAAVLDVNAAQSNPAERLAADTALHRRQHAHIHRRDADTPSVGPPAALRLRVCGVSVTVAKAQRKVVSAGPLLVATSSRLLAGAPKERPLSLRDVNETGAVYSCPVTTATADCSRMDLVATTNPSEEMVDGMWLGVTVASQRDLADGHVLACGHRYVKVFQGGGEEQRRMVGKCFVRGNDLTHDLNDQWQAYSYEVCDPNRDMDLEGMCNMGISGGITDTDVYIGSPGSYTWQVPAVARLGHQQGDDVALGEAQQGPVVPGGPSGGQTHTCTLMTHLTDPSLWMRRLING
ncbi:hypothetical protein CRUP_019978 [Coryphaenoides rupestris]|nr:hypothetical protein CRUP_019978 [Coryphaenoides rupestris]